MIYQLWDSKGSALLIVMALMILLTMIAIMSVDRATLDMDLSYNQLHSEVAFYAADAGIKHAVAVLNDSTSWRTGFVNKDIGGALYSVAVVDSVTQPALLDTIILQATANVSGAVANIEAKVGPIIDTPFKYAIFGYDRLRMSQASCTDSYNSDSGSYADTRLDEGASIGSNGDMWIRNDSYVSGDVVMTETGTLDMDSSATVAGEIIRDAQPADTTIIPASEFDSALANNSAPAGFSGVGYEYSGDNLAIKEDDTLVLSGGVYYFKDITVRRNGCLKVAPGEKVTIYTTGHIEVRDDASINADGKAKNLLIFGSGDSRLRVENNAEFRGAFLGYEATFRMRNTSRVYGSIIVGREELNVDGTLDSYSGCFHYDRALLKYQHGEIKGWKTIAWRER